MMIIVIFIILIIIVMMMMMIMVITMLSEGSPHQDNSVEVVRSQKGPSGLKPDQTWGSNGVDIFLQNQYVNLKFVVII